MSRPFFFLFAGDGDVRPTLFSMRGLPTRKYSKGDTHALARSLLTSEEAAVAILIFQTSHKRITPSGSHRW